MYKIIVRNTSIAIMNYELGECPRLEINFQVYDRITHSKYPLGMYYDEENKILYLPKIDIGYVEKCLGVFNETVYDKNCDPYDYIDGGIKLKYAPRDDVQKEALRFMTGCGEYLQYEKAHQQSLCLGTGKGKTYIAIATACYFEMRTIIITYSVNWLNQWAERIIQYTDITKKEIKFINGAAAVNKILNGKDRDYKMYLVTHSTIKSYASTYGWEKVGELFKKIKVGLKVIDEAHLNFENVSMIDFYSNTYKTYYLTATPMRSSEDENKVYSNYFRNVPVITLFDEENDPHTRYISIKYNSHPTIYDLNDCKNQYGLDRNKYMDYLINQPVYVKLLSIIIDLALKNNGKCLIYIGTNKAIEYTRDLIISYFPQLINEVGIFTTLTPKDQKEAQKEKKIILSTTKSAGAAMDIDGLKMTVVLNEPFKSHVLAQQTLGRTRAEETFYIECVDVGFNTIKKYYYYKKPIFQTYALSMNDIIMRDEELNSRYNNIIGLQHCTIYYGLYNTVQVISWNKPRNVITWKEK